MLVFLLLLLGLRAWLVMPWIWPQAAFDKRIMLLKWLLGIILVSGWDGLIFFILRLSSSDLALVQGLFLLTQILTVCGLSWGLKYAGRSQRLKYPLPNYSREELRSIGSPMQKLLYGVTFCAALTSCFYALDHGFLRAQSGMFDAFLIWNQRSLFLARSQEDLVHLFSEIQRLIPWTHADYPLLVPLMIAKFWFWQQSPTFLVSLLFALTCSVMVLLLLGSGTAFLQNKVQGLLAMLTLLSSAFLEYGLWQYADIPLALLYLSVIVVYCLRQSQTQHPAGLFCALGFLCALAPWIKNEGWVFLLAFLSALGLANVLLKPKSFMIRNLGWFSLGCLPPLLLILMWKGLVPIPNDVIQTGQTLGYWERLQDASRYTLIWQQFALRGQHFLPCLLPLFWLWQLLLEHRKRMSILLLGVLLIGMAWWQILLTPVFLLWQNAWLWQKKQASAKAFLVANLCYSFTLWAYALIYLLTPRELQWHLDTSLDRLLFQLIPLLVFSSFAHLVLPSFWLKYTGPLEFHPSLFASYQELQKQFFLLTSQPFIPESCQQSLPIEPDAPNISLQGVQNTCSVLRQCLLALRQSYQESPLAHASERIQELLYRLTLFELNYLAQLEKHQISKGLRPVWPLAQICIKTRQEIILYPYQGLPLVDQGREFIRACQQDELQVDDVLTIWGNWMRGIFQQPLMIWRSAQKKFSSGVKIHFLVFGGVCFIALPLILTQMIQTFQLSILIETTEGSGQTAISETRMRPWEGLVGLHRTTPPTLQFNFPQMNGSGRVQLQLPRYSLGSWQIAQILAKNRQGQILEQWDFDSLEKFSWLKQNLTAEETYRITLKGLTDLRRLAEDAELRLEMENMLTEMRLHIPPETILQSLQTLLGQHYSSKASFERALQKLTIDQDWSKRAFVRALFQESRYMTLRFGQTSALWSPVLKFDGLSQIEIIFR